MARAPFLVRLTRAAVLDAARVVLTVAQWVVLDPCLCRVLGHTEHPVYQDGRLVVILCIRCGQVV